MNTTKRITKEQKELAVECNLLLIEKIKDRKNYGGVEVINYYHRRVFYSIYVNEVLKESQNKNQLKAVQKIKFAQDFIKHFNITTVEEFLKMFLKGMSELDFSKTEMEVKEDGNFYNFFTSFDIDNLASIFPNNAMMNMYDEDAYCISALETNFKG